MAKYHDAPHTLDAIRDLPEPEETAPSAGHDEEMADKVRELDDEHTQGVEEAARGAQERSPEEEPPYAPGEFQGPGSGEEPEASEPAGEPTPPGEVPEGTIQEVLDWVGDDPQRAQQALDAERAGQNRQTLVSELEKRA